jgi:hypothetical protein
MKSTGRPIPSGALFSTFDRAILVAVVVEPYGFVVGLLKSERAEHDCADEREGRNQCQEIEHIRFQGKVHERLLGG